MKKLFLSVLALIIMAGAIFSPRRAYSFMPELEVCELHNYSAGGDCVIARQIDLNTDPTDPFLHNTINYLDSNDKKNTGAPAIHEKLGVFSTTVTCLTCPVANSQHDIIDNWHAQKRVDVLLC